jgi:hypothetical protein
MFNLKCYLKKHPNKGFVAHRIPGGQLRIVRCLDCNSLVDILFMPQHLGLDSLLESRLQTIPGYPKKTEAPERFR